MHRAACFRVLVIFLCAATVQAQTTREEFLSHSDYAGGLYRPYIHDHPVATPLPAGYVPFCITHYGRHSSRWLLSANVYTIPDSILGGAERAGVLTPLGNSLYERLKIAAADAVEADPEKVFAAWCNFQVWPMGSNVQVIFYRDPRTTYVLVKFLQCERETSIPIPTDMAPYYHWKDVRAFFMKRIAG